jgi:hypothetical protein
MYILLKYIINVCGFLRNRGQFWVFIVIFVLSASKLIRNGYYYLRSLRSVKICCPVVFPQWWYLCIWEVDGVIGTSYWTGRLSAFLEPCIRVAWNAMDISTSLGTVKCLRKGCVILLLCVVGLCLWPSATVDSCRVEWGLQVWIKCAGLKPFVELLLEQATHCDGIITNSPCNIGMSESLLLYFILITF